MAACIKHFVANDQEFERFSISSDVTARALHEIYLEPFRIAIEKANPWTLMSSYNRINGVHASENDTLLKDILKNRWGYDGLGVSDWYGTYSDAVLFGGLDLGMPGPARWMAPEKIIAAVEAGTLSETAIDDKVQRLLRLIERVTRRQVTAPIDNNLPQIVAAEAIVLLKNDGHCLPLNPQKKQTVAVIGENAHWAQIMGGGSSQVNPHRKVSPLAGIQARVSKQTEVVYQIGTPIHRLPPLPEMDWFTATDGASGGVTLSYFHNLDLSGEPAHTAAINKTELSWFGTINPYVDPTNFSLRMEGTLTVPKTGLYQLHLWNIGRARLWTDGEVLIDNWQPNGNPDQVTLVPVELTAGKAVSIVIEYITDPASRWRTLRLGCIPPLPNDPMQAAVDAATKADIAIVVAGLTREWESEGFDRENMALPGEQNALISRVAAANSNTIVVLNSGSLVEMPWADEVNTILQQWYGGQDAGYALASVLFGDVNPSGKLPTTFPQHLEDNPAFINYPGENGHVHYGEGIFVGYRYHEMKRIAPLFPFGHGLSYTSFFYSNLRLNGETFIGDDRVLVSLDVTNTGERFGQEVVQLYLHDEAARVTRLLQELKAFAKVALDASETKTVTLELTRQSLAFYDTAMHDWAVESGTFEVLVGASSRDIRLRGRFNWAGEPKGAPPNPTRDSFQL